MAITIYEIVWLNLRTGSRKTLTPWGYGFGMQEFQGGVVSSELKSAPDGPFPEPIERMFFLDGRRIGITASGATIHHWVERSAVVQIDGRPCTDSSALRSLLVI